ncbi:MAG: DUF4125 family protein [Lachnospiraceae bacterium]|nr:DUF4125 family protein [Lachnospiraceae bacterium]MCM1238130.1 DUF4125 family protein [Lachnospiraceae bacterium]
MDIQSVLNQVDGLFEENRGEEAEKLMREAVVQAVQEQDDNSLLQLLNELVGYYREAGRAEDSFQMAKQAVAQAERMGLAGTVPYATTLLNAANAYRAGGRLQESLDTYRKVQEIYDSQLAKDHIFVAGLQNNMSLLYQEMQQYDRAEACLLKALDIVRSKDAFYEIGVTYANLASTCVQLGKLEDAESYAVSSMETFRKIGVKDSHYGAALAAMGACHYAREEYGRAGDYYRQAMELVENGVGRNGAYYRLKEHVEACEKAAGKGLAIAREYYETYGKPMLQEGFPQYLGRIAAGLAGRGSDCFGYDDAASRDHDWGPDFCLWVTEDTYAQIGKQLEEAYRSLPEEFKGYKRAPRVNGKSRRGVIVISDFYAELTGAKSYEEIDWNSVLDSSLAAAVNGEIFCDEEGVFTDFRDQLLQGYPENIRLLKIGENAARFAQAAQYNYMRMKRRGDGLTACVMLWKGICYAMRLQHFIENRYPLHDKWLHKSLEETEAGRELALLLQQLMQEAGGKQDDRIQEAIERVGDFFAREMYGLDIISDIDPYLDAHSEELIYKASLAVKPDQELVEEIAKLEFEAFDKVHNEGGRASCQNDWPTFSIMRKSQYQTWNRTMLVQYLYDFHREYSRGHNLIEEKYGRMMESTAPEKYAEIRDHFPELTEEKKHIIQQICSMQVGWMEEFAAQYPALADNARSIHTAEDNPFDTSYETYLRGELGTYSDKMLELYGRYIVDYARNQKNLAHDIMLNNVKMYGYAGLEEAERKVKEAWG